MYVLVNSLAVETEVVNANFIMASRYSVVLFISVIFGEFVWIMSHIIGEGCSVYWSFLFVILMALKS